MVNRTFAVAAGSAAVLFGAAFAGNSDDVEACKAFAVEQGKIEADAYRFKFEGAKGGRVKTIEISVIPVEGDASFDAECTMKSGKVVDIEFIEA